MYDPATGKWAAAPPMGTARYYHAATALVVGGTARIYVSGGNGGGNTAEALGAHWHECNATAPGGGCTVCAACCDATAPVQDGGACEACNLKRCIHANTV